MARVKLVTTPAQESALVDTLRVCREGATWVAQFAFELRGSQCRPATRLFCRAPRAPAKSGDA